MKCLSKIALALGILLLCLPMLSCNRAGAVEEQGVNTIDIYYINRDENTIRSETYEIVNDNVTDVIKEVLEQMKRAPKDTKLKASPFSDVAVYSARLEEGKLILNLDAKYKDLAPTTEILVRAAIVKTLTQIDGVKFVSLEVDGAPLIDSTGEVVGLLNSDLFIDNAGGQISNNIQTTLQLYFASEDGTRLIPVQRIVEYNTNISLEKLVAEQLIAGPAAGESAYPVINPATKVVSVIVKDGTCYLNLDESFLTQVYSVNSEVTIYAIANSMIALNNVNKVQISVNGKTEITYRESMSLTNAFERNLDLVEDPQPSS